MHKVKLLLAIHSHQPVGNFEGVFEEAYQKAYLPFIESISKYPNFKLALHYSGGLLDWLASRHPDFLDKIKELLTQGRLEILAGGYYEPILPIIPQQDALGQVELLRNRVKELFSYEAKGAWLTERVWEPRIPFILSKSNITYTLVDDSHFKLISQDPEELSGYYATEDEGFPLFIFPGSERLRYLMPFKLPQETIDYLKWRLNRSKRDLAITFADDAEKFGLWPGTHKWVYKEEWLVNFLNLLEQNKDWIELQTFSDYLENNPATGRVYLPCASYREMLEWSEGYFRNFFIRYTEADNMHKKMLYISNKLRIYADRLNQRDFQEARSYLYKAQANDAYWHGVFGGLYLNHLRSRVQNYLIEAEKIIDKVASKEEGNIIESDINLDNNKEILINTPEHNLYFLPNRQAALFAWDYKPAAVNLTNTIMRRKEKYHRALFQEKLNKPDTNTSCIPSIHDIAGIKEEGLLERLCYDSYPRYSLFEHFLSPDATLDDFSSSRLQEIVAPLSIECNYKILSSGNKVPKIEFSYAVSLEGKPLSIIKSVRVEKDIDVNYEFKKQSNTGLPFYFGVEFNLSLYDPVFSISKDEFVAHSLNINDIWYNLKLNFDLSRPAKIWHFPIETISESESGIERSYQGLCLVFLWDLEGISFWSQRLNLNISIE